MIQKIPPMMNCAGLEMAPSIPPTDMNARAKAKASVACARCSTSLLEKCHIEPLWTGILLACGSSPNTWKNGRPPVMLTLTTLTWLRRLPSSLALEWEGGGRESSILSKGSSSILHARGSLSPVTFLSPLCLV